MTELSTQLSEPQPYDESTQLDEGRPTTEGQPAKEPEVKESRLDAIKRAAEDVAPKEDVKADEPKAEKSPDKVEAEPAKAETKPEEKPAPELKAETDKPKRSPIEAPVKFMPRAKELWANTPHEVRADMQRVISEAETEAATARESVKEYESIRPYAEMAKQSGTTIDQALKSYIGIEQTFRANPSEGFKTLLSNMQMNPVQAIGSILQAYGVRPEQLAEHIAQNPNEYTSLARPQQQPQPQSDQRVQTLEQQVQEMKAQLVHRDVEDKIIAPFARENPRYHELQDTIAAFLNSDMVPKSLSPHDRLAAAYDMAVRISPAKKSAPATEEDEGETTALAKDFGGDKSVRGAPASGVDTTNKRRGKLSRGDALNAAMAEFGIAH